MYNYFIKKIKHVILLNIFFLNNIRNPIPCFEFFNNRNRNHNRKNQKVPVPGQYSVVYYDHCRCSDYTVSRRRRRRLGGRVIGDRSGRHLLVNSIVLDKTVVSSTTKTTRKTMTAVCRAGFRVSSNYSLRARPPDGPTTAFRDENPSAVFNTSTVVGLLRFFYFFFYTSATVVVTPFDRVRGTKRVQALSSHTTFVNSNNNMCTFRFGKEYKYEFYFFFLYIYSYIITFSDRKSTFFSPSHFWLV